MVVRVAFSVIFVWVDFVCFGFQQLACALYSGTKPAEELDGPKPEKKRKSRLGSRKSKSNTEESTEEKFDFPGIAGMILVSPITSVLRLGAARTLAFRLLISGEELDNMAISMTADDEPAIPERGKKNQARVRDVVKESRCIREKLC